MTRFANAIAYITGLHVQLMTFQLLPGYDNSCIVEWGNSVEP